MNERLTLATVLIAMLAMPAVAHDYGRRGGMFSLGSGLTAAERESLAEERFAAADADGDGLLSVEEILNAVERAANARREDRVLRMIEAHDADGDGGLSLSELQEPREGALFDRIDTDGDDSISREELSDHPGMRRMGRRVHR
jgi:Ca2+-binding EF-hand superfamily protein